jgi:hypothetical protein
LVNIRINRSQKIIVLRKINQKNKKQKKGENRLILVLNFVNRIFILSLKGKIGFDQF